MTAIETAGLTKRYGKDVLAVDDLDLSVREGEIFGFLGPNGAGKSTTIDMLLDYVRPTAGSASVLGYDTRTETQAVRDRVGILPDDYGLYDRLTARSHVEYAIELKGTTEDPEAILERVGLSNAAWDRRVGGFSTGMAQRLAIGIALVGDPELLVLDEPSNGLDPNGVRLVREIAREHADRGATVFFSSHILSQVEAVCDRVGIMNRGSLVAVDSIDGLRDALGTGASLTLHLDTAPEESAIREIAGVTSVRIEERTLRASIAEPEAKIQVIDAVREAGHEILDIQTSEASLEVLFQAYTDAGEEAVP